MLRPPDIGKKHLKRWSKRKEEAKSNAGDDGDRLLRALQVSKMVESVGGVAGWVEKRAWGKI